MISKTENNIKNIVFDMNEKILEKIKLFSNKLEENIKRFILIKYYNIREINFTNDELNIAFVVRSGLGYESTEEIIVKKNNIKYIILNIILYIIFRINKSTFIFFLIFPSFSLIELLSLFDEYLLNYPSLIHLNFHQNYFHFYFLFHPH